MTTWQKHDGNVAADHRYSGPGTGSVYAGTSQQTALAEISHYPGALEGRVVVTARIRLNNALDLTNPSVRSRLGVSNSDITGDSYIKTQEIGNWARASGYDGIRAPSARDQGGTNVIVF
ncbi:RES family NAD+ phosphorylase [Rubritalea squalenifaciens]|uniref:RES family NAD+ phosphorylase n=1 Tax=Rubritalea squalenifaciens TaxID=407226 RepID=UPI00135657DC